MDSGVRITDNDFEFLDANDFRDRLEELYLLFCERVGLKPERGMDQFRAAVGSSDMAALEDGSGHKAPTGAGIPKVLRPDPNKPRYTVDLPTVEALVNGLFHERVLSQEEHDRWREELCVALVHERTKRFGYDITPDNPAIVAALIDGLWERLREGYRRGTDLHALEALALFSLIDGIYPGPPSSSTFMREWIEGTSRFLQYVGDTYLLGATPALFHLVEGLFQDGRSGSDEHRLSVGPMSLNIVETPDTRQILCQLTLDDPTELPVVAWIYRQRNEVSSNAGEKDPEQALVRAFLFVDPEPRTQSFTVQLDGDRAGASWQLRVRSLKPEAS